MFNYPVYNPMERMKVLANQLFSSGWRNPAAHEIDLANLYESKEGFLLKFLAPGIKQEDVVVDFQDGTLSISMKRDTGSKIEEETKPVLQERLSMNFIRRYRIDSGVDTEAIHAEMKNGLLEILIPKKEETKPQKITVSVH